MRISTKAAREIRAGIRYAKQDIVLAYATRGLVGAQPSIPFGSSNLAYEGYLYTIQNETRKIMMRNTKRMSQVSRWADHG